MSQVSKALSINVAITPSEKKKSTYFLLIHLFFKMRFVNYIQMGIMIIISLNIIIILLLYDTIV